MYYAQVNVVFLGPSGPNNPNSLQSTTQSLITTAGAIARVVGDPRAGAQPVSDTVSLANEGITHGYSVRLPNGGGQWAINFDRPLLDVQVSGGSPGEVQGTVNRVEARIETSLRGLQDEAHVPATQRITTLVSPDSPPVYRGAGSHTRAAGATVLLGLGVIIATTVVLDRAVRRRRRAHHPPGALAAA